MSEVVKVQESSFENIYECIYNDGSVKLCTKNLTPGINVYGEKLIRYKGVEYREWNAFRSKLAAAILKGLTQNPIRKGHKILYLGAASGTTVSHISDIVEQEGKIYGIEFSPRVIRELLMVAQHRPNILPILADARFPNLYKPFVEYADIQYVDIAQPDQTDIAIYNAENFLKANGYMFLAIKARSIDVTRDPREIYKEEVKKLENAGFEIIQIVQLDPYDKDHAMVLAKYKGK
ncbi:MAG: fibrillarin-like rRNA/tRNA 2'-O-methyltransferase [Sulfolobaceae archaeon]